MLLDLSAASLFQRNVFLFLFVFFFFFLPDPWAMQYSSKHYFLLADKKSSNHSWNLSDSDKTDDDWKVSEAAGWSV